MWYLVCGFAAGIAVSEFYHYRVDRIRREQIEQLMTLAKRKREEKIS